MRSMMDVFAQLERALIASRTRGALAAKRARGEKTGGDAPIGFDVADDGRKLVANPSEARALALVKSLRDEGLSIRAIAERLNAESVPARGGRWHATTVARLLGRSA
jgi:DNA invertase Pin-like site-specific DNA recombinase